MSYDFFRCGGVAMDSLVCWGLCYHWNAYEIAIIIISYFKTIFKIRGSGVKSNWV